MHRHELRRTRRGRRLESQQDDAVAIIELDLARHLTVVHGRRLLAGDALEVFLERDFARAVAAWIDQRDPVLELAPIHAVLPRRGRGGLDRLAEFRVVLVEPYQALVALRVVRE